MLKICCQVLKQIKRKKISRVPKNYSLNEKGLWDVPTFTFLKFLILYLIISYPLISYLLSLEIKVVVQRNSTKPHPSKLPDLCISPHSSCFNHLLKIRIIVKQIRKHARCSQGEGYHLTITCLCCGALVKSNTKPRRLFGKSLQPHIRMKRPPRVTPRALTLQAGHDPGERATLLERLRFKSRWKRTGKGQKGEGWKGGVPDSNAIH